MSIVFGNNTSRTVFACFSLFDPNCNGWNKFGWWTFEPGRRRAIKEGDTRGLRFFFYAEDAFGNVWNGDLRTTVPQVSFYMCWQDGCPPPCREIGFRQVDTDNSPVFIFDIGSAH
ncbi:DUF1036 domain-containing protein [Brevibacillus laterosporus]|uniref:DUF1036 domain-containing protein n=2 Tax=Brevibacillus TaxID=55080 RepID=UPI003CC812A9|nr:DUF1036 domain-containing protein [Brevibacillus laterosporus]